MNSFICYVDKKGNLLPCMKETPSVDATNCKGCNYESRHNKYLDEINNNQKGD